jgi:riboflavin-specific deaminase-like protein
LRTPPDAGILKNQTMAKTIIATTIHACREKLARLDEMGIETIVVEQDNDHRVHLTKLFAELGKRKISSVLVEGGAAIITSILKGKLADRVVIIIAPKIVGKGVDAVGDLEIQSMDESLKLIYRRILRKGDDLIIDGRFEK